MAAGAVPISRVLWKKPDHPDEPLAPGKTSTHPVKQTPKSSCRGSMTVPDATSMPPKPEIGSCVTRARALTTPGTIPRPRSSITAGRRSSAR